MVILIVQIYTTMKIQKLANIGIDMPVKMLVVRDLLEWQ